MTEIAVIIEALFIGDKRKAVSYMELFILKNYPPPALPIHYRTDEQFLSCRLKMLIDGKVEDNHACLDSRVPRELITMTEIPIEDIVEKWNKTKEVFTCQNCKNELPIEFSVRTKGVCYLCDPNITLAECLSDEPI